MAAAAGSSAARPAPGDAPASPEEVTVVVPTLNEVEAIGAVIDELRMYGFSKILVVDGRSTDGTPEVAASRGATVITQRGRGKSDAIRTALDFVDTPYVLVIDGDYTYDPSSAGKMLELAQSYDEVIGVRAEGRENIPVINRLGNWLLTKMFNVLFGTKLRDVCSGMYLIRTSVASRAWFETKGFSIEVELAAHVASTTRRIAEVDIKYRPRIGKPKLGARHGFLIALDAVRLALRYNPAFFIFAVGATALLPAAAILAWVAHELLFLGVKHHVWAIIGTVLAGAGVQSLLLAVMALFIKRVEYRITEKLEAVERGRERGCGPTPARPAPQGEGAPPKGSPNPLAQRAPEGP